eukprot:CAMPEP_0176284556 /NCGR_PEP_ID=MMETSP0121_2-20121125/51911_1 /TAXON_ID=160619 /ORGANISM="Kryptoperidinium foliaceum, Strain CCMP 1326" /LENGTH=225 /DNA_ID=CAMNT_0017625005 /DNA_START=54 /DNA_END=728 /DNA_ORIENTATION=+
MSTIEITGCSTSTTRMILKREMERFGHVDVCHMGNRDNPSAEPPWVRFADPKAADSALDAIKAGLVIIDGFAINAQKSNRRGPPLVSREPREERLAAASCSSSGAAVAAVAEAVGAAEAAGAEGAATAAAGRGAAAEGAGAATAAVGRGAKGVPEARAEVVARTAAATAAGTGTATAGADSASSAWRSGALFRPSSREACWRTRRGERQPSSAERLGGWGRAAAA